MTPEKTLWRAVLNQAVIDFACPGYEYGLDRALVHRLAGNWFLSNSRGVGSFLFICDFLSINPEWFRKQLFGTSIDTLKDRVSTQHRSRDKLASVAASE
jgi:hypothetical protein